MKTLLLTVGWCLLLLWCWPLALLALVVGLVLAPLLWLLLLPFKVMGVVFGALLALLTALLFLPARLLGWRR